MRVSHFLGSMRPGHDGVTRVAYRMRDILMEKPGKYDFISPILPAEAPSDMRPVSSIPFPLSTDYRLAVCSPRSIRKVLLELEPDVIHIHSPCTLGRAAVWAANSLGIPAVATYHTHFPTYLKYYRVRYLSSGLWRYLRGLYNRCQAVVVPSQETLADLEAHGIRNLIHIPHGVDTDQFSPGHRSQKWRESVAGIGQKEKKIVTFVGRLVWEKNLKLLAQVAELVQAQDRIQFVIVGDGPARAKLEQMMPQAIFTGFLGERDLPIAYASSDLFIFPSITETFGNVTVEAMASGLPVICASAGGARDLVRPGVNGLLASPSDPHEFAKAIDQLVLRPDQCKRMGRAARMTADELRWENSVQKYRRLYSKLRRASQVRHSDAEAAFQFAFQSR